METERKEPVLKGPIILERGCWGEAFRDAFASHCSPVAKGWLSFSSRPPWLLPLLLCRAQPCCRVPQGPAPFPTASLPREARGEGGTAPSHTDPEVSILAIPVPQALPLPHELFALCLPAPSPRRDRGRQGGMEEMSSPWEGAWYQAAGTTFWGGCGTCVQ